MESVVEPCNGNALVWDQNQVLVTVPKTRVRFWNQYWSQNFFFRKQKLENANNSKSDKHLIQLIENPILHYHLQVEPNPKKIVQ